MLPNAKREVCYAFEDISLHVRMARNTHKRNSQMWEALLSFYIH